MEDVFSKVKIPEVKKVTRIKRMAAAKNHSGHFIF
jgi:hypothetical protein